MKKGKYFLKTLGKAIHASKTFLDGKEMKLPSPCCDGNQVYYNGGDFVCEVVKLEMVGKEKVAYFFTSIDEKLIKKASKTSKKTTKKVAKKTSKKTVKKTTKKVTKKTVKKTTKKTNKKV